MTARLALIGDSHLAALRAAAEDAPPGPALTFLAAPNNLMEDVRLDGPVLTPTTEATRVAFQRFGGVDRLDLSGFDAVVLVGLQLNVFWAAALYRAHRFRGQKGWRQHDPKRPLISRPCATETLRARLMSARALRLAGRMAQVLTCPVVLVPEPRPGLAILAPGQRFPAFRRLHANGDGALVSEMFETAAAGLPHRVLPQPADTILDGMFTAPDWSQGAQHLPGDGKGDGQYPEGDFLHANRRYGALVLSQVARAFG